ncbi:hypothetical protein BCR42DRAFT_134526 [Absidia repens]|uniref:ASX DEUBAD domain-containing protein n=1 Tax=Absidia repens TaxID=90262 RepID=A0A1X2IWF2_9FUNG|nr:hypothetical protein BCR42DRAFT_134526 [Absidia repens]
MTTPSSRKSTRGKKVALDLTNPRSQLAKCDDIKAMLKDKVRKLSQEAQKELIMLLPACDQQYDDLNNALNANSTFWSSLDEWHCLLQCGDLKSSKRNPSARDLQSIPWKDDNYEHFWGERMKLNKHSTKGDEPQPQQSLPKVRQQSKTTRKPKTTEKPKVERRGRKKKNVEPPPEHDDKDSVLASVKPVKNGVGSDGTMKLGWTSIRNQQPQIMKNQAKPTLPPIRYQQVASANSPSTPTNHLPSIPTKKIQRVQRWENGI